MKKIGIIFALCLSFISCKSTYFYSSLATPNEDIQQTENGDFFIDKDSLWIAYSFNGQDAPIQITVFNKSEKPLFINWRKSELKLKDKDTNHYRSYSLASFASNSSKPTLFNSAGEFYDLSGEMQETEEISQIPPSMMVSFVPTYLNKNIMSSIPRKGYKKDKLEKKDKTKAKVDKFYFTNENTPLSLAGSIYVYSEKQRPYIYTNEFFLASIIKTKSVPVKKLSAETRDRGDFAYIKRKSRNRFPHFLGSAAKVVGISVAAITVEALVPGFFSDEEWE